ncbi:hypothetical protein Bbelb_004900 [Branchiostoma belcheri]|nr:hypothetical protein Bbelb_004900 [Branchiostoma belcheri]
MAAILGGLIPDVSGEGRHGQVTLDTWVDRLIKALTVWLPLLVSGTLFLGDFIESPLKIIITGSHIQFLDINRQLEQEMNEIVAHLFSELLSNNQKSDDDGHGAGHPTTGSSSSFHTEGKTSPKGPTAEETVPSLLPHYRGSHV